MVLGEEQAEREFVDLLNWDENLAALGNTWAIAGLLLSHVHGRAPRFTGAVLRKVRDGVLRPRIHCHDDSFANEIHRRFSLRLCGRL